MSLLGDFHKGKVAQYSICKLVKHIRLDDALVKIGFVEPIVIPLHMSYWFMKM